MPADECDVYYMTLSDSNSRTLILSRLRVSCLHSLSYRRAETADGVRDVGILLELGELHVERVR